MRATTNTIIRALRILAHDSEDSVAMATLLEAAGRLEQLTDDIKTCSSAISVAAGRESRRTEAGKAFRAAADRLVAEAMS